MTTGPSDTLLAAYFEIKKQIEERKDPILLGALNSANIKSQQNLTTHCRGHALNTGKRSRTTKI